MAAAQHEVVINAPPSRVWSLLGDVRTWESWNPKVKGGRMLEGDEFYPGATFQYTCDASQRRHHHPGDASRPSQRSGNCRQSFRLEADGDKTRVISSAEIGIHGFAPQVRASRRQPTCAGVAGRAEAGR